ncbi:MAG TPA: dihydrodipicolinate synthase family protein, partial [Spirochaetia bacterium]|nr:dihydrodipicolinate synthase family protein [Spirochaetia bacterium]
GFGFGVPLVTPTDRHGKVDHAAARRLWEFLIPQLDVAVVLGTTGRGRFIINEEPAEARRLVDLGVELCGRHRTPLVIGTGAETVERAKELTAYAAERGVYAVLVTPPVFAASPFARSLGHNPLSAGYQDRLLREYFFPILDAVPRGSTTRFLPYVFPTLTDADPRAFLRPEILERLWERAAGSGRTLDGGKLTLRDDAVALDYSEKCHELSFQAGMDSTVHAFLGNPRMHFSGAILGSGNLIPKTLKTHVADCLRLREAVRGNSPEAAHLTRVVLSRQNQVSALFNDLWDSGLFGPLIHGFLGIGSPYQVAPAAASELGEWARVIGTDAPTLVDEIASYCPESPLSREARAAAEKTHAARR